MVLSPKQRKWSISAYNFIVVILRNNREREVKDLPFFFFSWASVFVVQLQSSCVQDYFRLLLQLRLEEEGNNFIYTTTIKTFRKRCLIGSTVCAIFCTQFKNGETYFCQVRSGYVLQINRPKKRGSFYFIFFFEAVFSTFNR